MPDELLSAALEAIAVERPDKFERSFELTRAMLNIWGESDDLADRILDTAPREQPPEILADLINILSWQTTDNGANLTRSAERWLRAGDDLQRIRVVQNLEVVPFLDRLEMEAVLGRLAEKQPAVRSWCLELVAKRRAIQM